MVDCEEGLCKKLHIRMHVVVNLSLSSASVLKILHLYKLRTVPAAFTDVGSLQVTTIYERTHHAMSDISSARGRDSPQPDPYGIYLRSAVTKS